MLSRLRTWVKSSLAEGDRTAFLAKAEAMAPDELRELAEFVEDMPW